MYLQYPAQMVYLVNLAVEEVSHSVLKVNFPSFALSAFNS